MATRTIDRSADLSQPLDKLGPDETLKFKSDHLRGTIAHEPARSNHRRSDLREQQAHEVPRHLPAGRSRHPRRAPPPEARAGLTFMVRVRLPGGVCTPEQWLKIDALAQAHGGNTIRLTTRQTFQFHWVLKERSAPTIQGLHEVLLDTIAACGDDSRGVMATANPADSDVHAEVAALAKQVSDHVIPKMRAYHEIWYGKERVASSEAGRAAVRRDLSAAKIQDRFRRPAVERHRRLHARPRASLPLSARMASTGSTWRLAAAWAEPTMNRAPIRGSPTSSASFRRSSSWRRPTR